MERSLLLQQGKGTLDSVVRYVSTVIERCGMGVEMYRQEHLLY
jgi:hypothetical protein